MTESVSQFRVGGVYRDVTNSIVRLDEACVHEGEAGWARASIFDKRYDCWQSYLALFCLSDGRWHGEFSAMNLASGELHQVNGQWVPVEQKLSFPSGSVITTSGDKIVGREEPAHEQHIGNYLMTTEELQAGLRAVLDALRVQDVIPEPIRPALTWRTETPFDPFKGFDVEWSVECQAHPAGFASPDLQATSPFSGSAYLLPKTA